MHPQHAKIREVQKESWNKSSAGWKKWDDLVMNFFKPAGDEMIGMLNIRDDHHILDVATGTGEPGLTIASMLDSGKVTGTDLSEQMLKVAVENSLHRGIHNFDTVCCDVSTLPFDDKTFDGVTCRYGFMFFPDMELALKEMIRVLKPEGRIATACWNIPEENFWITASMGTMMSRLQLTPPSADSPGLFRCAQPGFMTNLFKQGGLINIEEKRIEGKLPCDTLETYWSFITEVASPVAFSKADAETRQQIKDEILEKVNAKFPDGKIGMNSCAIVLCGEKPM